MSNGLEWSHVEPLTWILIPGAKVTLFNGNLWIHDLIRTDGSTEINKTISVPNQTLIFVTSYASYLLVMRYLLWYARFQLYHLRVSHILKSELGEPLHVQYIRPICSQLGERERERWKEKGKDWISSFWRSATTKAISLLRPQIAISCGTEIEYCTRYETLLSSCVGKSNEAACSKDCSCRKHTFPH